MNTYTLIRTLTHHMTGLCPFCLGKYKKLGVIDPEGTCWRRIRLMGKWRREYLKGWENRPPQVDYWKRLYIPHNFECRRKDRSEL